MRRPSRRGRGQFVEGPANMRPAEGKLDGALLGERAIGAITDGVDALLENFAAFSQQITEVEKDRTPPRRAALRN